MKCPEDDQPRYSEASDMDDILPAFLTLVTGRGLTPIEVIEALPPTAEIFLKIALTATRWSDFVIDRLRHLPRLAKAKSAYTPKYSVDDHLPSHYVDVSMASVGKTDDLPESFFAEA